MLNKRIKQDSQADSGKAINPTVNEVNTVEDYFFVLRIRIGSTEIADSTRSS